MADKQATYEIRADVKGRESITGLADGSTKTATVTATRSDGTAAVFEVDVLLLEILFHHQQVLQKQLEKLSHH